MERYVIEYSNYEGKFTTSEHNIIYAYDIANNLACMGYEVTVYDSEDYEIIYKI